MYLSAYPKLFSVLELVTVHYTPFLAGKWNNIKIFKNKTERMLRRREKVMITLHFWLLADVS